MSAHRRQRGSVAAVLAVILAVGGALAGPRLAHACAGCRNPSLPVTRLANVEIDPGQWRASAILTGTFINVVHEAGCADLNNCGEVPVQPLYMHDQNLYPGELRAVVERGFTASWGVEAQLPFRLVYTTIRYTTPDGAAYTPLDPGVHHRNETVAGVGDVWLLGRYMTTAGDVRITARGGVSLPLGKTEENPFALGDMGLRHQHIQLGTGTFDPVLALDGARQFGPVQVGVYGLAHLALYENSRGFQAGNRFYGGLQGGLKLFGNLSGALGPDVVHERPERWGGEVRQDGNLGRTELLANLSLTQTMGELLMTVVIRVPFYRHIVMGDEAPGRLSSPILVSLIASYAF
jgi:hypothetical protein